MHQEDDPFILGQYVGDQFLEDVNIMLKELKNFYKGRYKYDFDNEEFMNGFLEAFVEGFDK